MTKGRIKALERQAAIWDAETELGMPLSPTFLIEDGAGVQFRLNRELDELREVRRKHKKTAWILAAIVVVLSAYVLMAVYAANAHGWSSNPSPGALVAAVGTVLGGVVLFFGALVGACNALDI